MALSYAGVSLLLDTPEHAEFVARYHDLAAGRDTVNCDHTSTLPHLAVPAAADDGPLRIGVLRWPTGASRCATFHCLVDGTRLAAIREEVGNPAAFADLVLSDGLEDHEVTASMRMLPARVVHDTGSDDESKKLYLLSLVDSRFDWRWKAASVTSQPASWSALYSTLATGVGATLTPATVASAYANPSPRWVQYLKSLPALLDAAAASVQQRVVVALDGTATTVGYTAAQAAADSQYEDIRKLIGGRIEQTDFQRTVPASVTVAFGKTTDGVPQPDPHSVNKTLASLAITGFGSETGLAGLVKVLNADLVYTGSNGTACSTLATAAAADWYGWQLCDLDFTAPGIWNWEPTGAEDAVEWVYQDGGRLLTRVLRPPFQVQENGDYLPPATEDECEATDSGSGCCGPGSEVFPSIDSEPENTGSDPIIVADQTCVEGILYVLRAKQRIVWNAAVCRPVIDLYDYSYSEEGCCDCGSGTGTATGYPFCEPYPELCVTWFGTGTGECVNDFVTTLTLDAAGTGGAVWRGYLNDTPVQLVCGDGAPWTLSIFMPLGPSDCSVYGGSGSTVVANPLLPFPMVFNIVTTVNGVSTTIQGTVIEGPCESGSGSCCDILCETYTVDGEVLERVCGEPEFLGLCAWRSENYLLVEGGGDSYVLLSPPDISEATCGWNAPEDWDGSSCVLFLQTTLGACGDITVCCSAGSGSATGTGGGGDGCNGGTAVASPFSSCASALAFPQTLGVQYDYDSAIVTGTRYWVWAVSPSTQYHLNTACLSGFIDVGLYEGGSDCSHGFTLAQGTGTPGTTPRCQAFTTGPSTTYVSVRTTPFPTSGCVSIRLTAGAC